MNKNCSDGYCLKGCNLNLIAKILVIVGGLNWGLVGLGMLLGRMGGWNLVNLILGSMPALEALIYLLVGISAVILIIGCKCKKCPSKCVGPNCASPIEEPKIEENM
jgi:hypothetical protein